MATNRTAVALLALGVLLLPILFYLSTNAYGTSEEIPEYIRTPEHSGTRHLSNTGNNFIASPTPSISQQPSLSEQVHIRSPSSSISQQPSLSEQVHIRPPSSRLIYLVLVRDSEQGEFWTRLSTSDIDVLIMCWKDPSCDTQTTEENVEMFYAANLTWTTSRNKLLEMALEKEKTKGIEYQYFIFADGDVSLTFSKNFAPKDFLKTVEHYRPDIVPFRWYEHQLKEYDAPFVCTNKKNWNCQSWKDRECIIVRYCDADFNAFHRDAINFLLPYEPHFDSRSWLTSQAILLFRLLCVHGHAIQINGFTVNTYASEEHAKYSREGDPWEMADSVVNKIIPWEIASILNKEKPHLLITDKCVSPKAAKKTNWRQRVNPGCINFNITL